jgi:predicted acylesterase/phospholipase RssA
MDLYMHSATSRHGVVLDYLSTWTTLPFTAGLTQNVHNSLTHTSTLAPSSVFLQLKTFQYPVHGLLTVFIIRVWLDEQHNVFEELQIIRYVTVVPCSVIRITRSLISNDKKYSDLICPACSVPPNFNAFK